MMRIVITELRGTMKRVLEQSFSNFDVLQDHLGFVVYADSGSVVLGAWD